MRKKNKLYTANRWNQPLFAQGVDRENYNIFDGMFSSTLNTSLSKPGLLGNDSSGLSYSVPKLTQPNLTIPTDWSNGLQSKLAVQNSQNLVNSFGKEASANNPFKSLTGKGLNISGIAKAGIGALGSTVGTIGNKLISGGLSSGAGNAISSIGGTVGGAISTINPVAGGIVSAASGIIGGGVNALFGMKTDQKKLNAANQGTDYLNNFQSNATSFEDIQGPNAVAAVQNAYKGGLFKKGKARRKNNALRAERADAESWANRSVDNNIDNIADTQMDNLLGDYYAFGGPLGGTPTGGAIDYGFMSDYLTMKNNAAQAKNKIPTNVFGNLPITPMESFAEGGPIHIKKSHRGLFTEEAKNHGMGVQEFASHVLVNKDKYSPEVVKRANFARNASKFALGGDLQTNGADFTDGLTFISAGGSHENNPYQGVQVGINRDNGAPNLVEEGETIFDDYVFSKRIKPDAQTKAKFHVSKNADISFADLSKKLEKESEERPNDPISIAGLTKQLHDLAEEQERQKGEQQQREAEEAFNQLPPEQQQAIMQQAAMQEQQAQEQPTEEQEVNPQQEPQQQVDEQMMQQQTEQPQMEGNEEQINACGGKMNRFDKGGDLKKKIYGLLGLYTDSDFDKWANDHKMPKVTDWDNILSNKQFLETLSGSNPALSDAISRGYDFDTYVPSKDNKLTFDFTHGGWGKEDYDAWNGSTDAAWKEAVEKGLVKKGMNSEEIGKALSQTDAYKRGSDWLKDNEGNRLTYLQSILNSKDAPQAARDYAARYVDSNGWKKDAKRDYQTIFEDPNGTGVRNTHPGTYWKTPNEILRDNQAKNFVVNDDGTVEEIYGNVPKDWTSAGNYSWADANSDYAYNYYKRPTATDAKGNPKQEEEIVPVHKPTWGRYAGLFGSAVGLGMQALGIGKPDYSRMDAAVEAASGAPALATYKPIGDYIGYRPMDIWYEQNRMNANSRATDRAILNNNSTIGTKTAGLLANGYNSQLASGNLYRQALEYNDAQRQKVADFNRGTNMFNSQAFNQTSATNAQIQNNQRNFKAQMQMDAARQRMAADAAWNQGIYGNVNGLFSGLSNWGKENAQHNMIADMAADGIFGTMNDQNIGKGYVVKRVPKKKACGGRLNRKRGLTF